MPQISSCFIYNSTALIKRAENTENYPIDIHSLGNDGLLEGGRKPKKHKERTHTKYHVHLLNIQSEDETYGMEDHFNDMLPE